MKDEKIDFSKRPDLSKLNEPEEKIERKKEKGPISLGVKEVLTEAPEIIVEAEKSRWIVKVLVVLITAVLVGTGLYFVLPQASSPVDISIDFLIKDIKYDFVDITPSEENGQTVYKLMPGDHFTMNYTIASVDDDEIANEDVFVRIKFYVVCDGHMFNHLIYTSDDYYTDNLTETWVKGVDGYYYYKNVLKENDVFTSSNELILSTAIGNEYQGKAIKIVLLAECLQAGQNGYQAIESEWETAPIPWKNMWKEEII